MTVRLPPRTSVAVTDPTPRLAVLRRGCRAIPVRRDDIRKAPVRRFDLPAVSSDGALKLPKTAPLGPMGCSAFGLAAPLMAWLTIAVLWIGGAILLARLARFEDSQPAQRRHGIRTIRTTSVSAAVIV